MGKVFYFVVAIGSLCFVGLVGFAQIQVPPPCFEVAQAATKDCLPHLEKKCPTIAINDPDRVKKCAAAIYESKPATWPSTIVQSASGTTHEQTEQCWYSQKCSWQAITHYYTCAPNLTAPKTWTNALQLQPDNVICDDPYFVPAPEL